MQKGFAPVFILVIIAVIFLAGVAIWRIFFIFDPGAGFYVPPQQKACTLEAKICPDGTGVGRSGSNCEFAACPSVKPSATASSSAETANWKTYKNEKYLFQLDYPSNSEISELKPGRHIASKLIKGLISDELYIADLYDAGMEIQVFNNNDNLSSKDWVYNFEESYNLEGIKDGQIDGKNAVKYSTFKGDHTDATTTVTIGQYAYDLSCPYTDPNVEMTELAIKKALCQKILATFKFN